MSIVSKSMPSLMSSRRSSDDIITSSTIGSSSSSMSPEPRRLKDAQRLLGDCVCSCCLLAECYIILISILHCLLHVVPHLGVVHADPLLLLTGLSLLPLCQHPGDLCAVGQWAVFKQNL